MDKQVYGKEDGKFYAESMVIQASDMHRVMDYALGVFSEDHWSGMDRIEGLPLSNDYDFSCCQGLTPGLFRSLLGCVEKLPSGNNPERSANIMSVFIPPGMKEEMCDWMPGAFRFLEEKNVPCIVSPSASSLSFGIHDDIEPFSEADGCHLWVILDGPLGVYSSGYVRITEEFRQNFMKVKFRTEG